MDTSGNGKVTIVVGGRGTGKTTLVREYLQSVNPGARMVYDPAAHYLDLYNHKLLPFEVFKYKATQVEKACVVYEEATINFSNRGDDKDLKNLLVMSRYKNNSIFLVYHSLRAVPRYIFDLCNYIILFKTNDAVKKIESKFESDLLADMYSRVKANKNFHYYEVMRVL